jgi:hypothetical protein
MEEFTSYLITFALGVVGTIVGWFIRRYMNIRSKFNEERDNRILNLFRENIPAARSEASNEILINIIKWMVIGNIMFGISGMTYFLEIAQLYTTSYVIAGSVSVIALFCYVFALMWVAKFLKFLPSRK